MIITFRILLTTLLTQVLSENLTDKSENHEYITEELVDVTRESDPNFGELLSRTLPAGTCTSSIPCTDGACCNSAYVVHHTSLLCLVN